MQLGCQEDLPAVLLTGRAYQPCRCLWSRQAGEDLSVHSAHRCGGSSCGLGPTVSGSSTHHMLLSAWGCSIEQGRQLPAAQEGFRPKQTSASIECRATHGRCRVAGTGCLVESGCSPAPSALRGSFQSSVGFTAFICLVMIPTIGVFLK